MLPQSLGLFAFSAFAAVAQGASVSLDARQGLKLAWIKGGCSTVELNFCKTLETQWPKKGVVNMECSVYTQA
ncbi:hypothetical protein Ptr902_07230 [Pyrenophora tritici-repentis]|uniref:Uncharacterized protein n=1 Tax=Pyrenophora tritici-repentis TaxID=45151 RepID=A0A5M9KQX0_9PLEO|nr:hypothetical protein PtrV1_12943 [Pyrenophora tritici-repentis]KAF7447099.1 hypothetical protein A1F99_085460 [Pyrenophora tritici-repentis]KAF7569394.1 hypothetical protein PtrM4_118090 [Pyrenophora tritici-repentis]KAI0569471.1 hypothetical protein Alg215_11618 [Pyrenophora tritici-repentis]KAI0570402.1 hypothetical protein Alg130_11244 [Pyrenophora tritici-repentis]